VIHVIVIRVIAHNKTDYLSITTEFSSL